MVLLRDMHMDDILHSEETVEDAVLVHKDLTKVLGGAGFRAQKCMVQQSNRGARRNPTRGSSNWIRA